MCFTKDRPTISEILAMPFMQERVRRIISSYADDGEIERKKEPCENKAQV